MEISVVSAYIHKNREADAASRFYAVYFLIPCRMRFICRMLSSSAPLCFKRLTSVIRPIIR